MKKVSKILISLLIIFVASATVLFIWQKDNISAMINGLTNSSEDLAVRMDNHREKVKTEVKKYVSNPIEDITAEDEEKLIKGYITVEEVADKYNLPLEYMKDDVIETDESKDVSTKSTASESIPVSNTQAIDEAISNSVSKMYALKAKYVNKLGELERNVLEEYKNLPKDKQNEDSKYDIVKKNIDYVASLEKKCDDEVALVLSKLESELEKYNGDKEIVQILKDAYEDEKEVKKAYYLSLYNN